jgi:pectinesterase inhibitor-like protein
LSSIGEEVVQDCFSNLEDSIEQLQDSLDAMINLDSDFDREFQISNIKTWVSSAITNDQTCYDGFDEMNVDSTLRDKIRSKVLNVARKTSNALYFINNNIY